jgi:hypothetical protein
MNEELIAELAKALDMPLSPERRAGLAERLAAQIAGGGGLPADELDGIEPAIVFEPEWPQ